MSPRVVVLHPCFCGAPLPCTDAALAAVRFHLGEAREYFHLAARLKATRRNA